MPEATDLYWVEAGVLGVGDEPVDDVLVRARVLLDGGACFGPGTGSAALLNRSGRSVTARDLRCRTARRFT